MSLKNLIDLLFGKSSAKFSKKRGKLLKTFSKIKDGLQKNLTEEEEYIETLKARRELINAEINDSVESIGLTRKTIENLKPFLS